MNFWRTVGRVFKHIQALGAYFEISTYFLPRLRTRKLAHASNYPTRGREKLSIIIVKANLLWLWWLWEEPVVTSSKCSCSYSCSLAKTEISFSTCFCLPVKMYSHGTSKPLPLSWDRRRDPLMLQTTWLSRFWMKYQKIRGSSSKSTVASSSVEHGRPTYSTTVNRSGRGQFRTDL